MLSNEFLFTMTHINIVQQEIILVQERSLADKESSRLAVSPFLRSMEE
jgi:hypothetical protein